MVASESTQEEANTRVILHSVYSFQNEGVEQVITHGNDTDTIRVYYASTLLRHLQELWIQTAHKDYIAINRTAYTLGSELYQELPFIHSLNGHNITTYLYFQGEKGGFLDQRFQNYLH